MLLVRTTIEALSRRSVLVGCVALVVLASSHAQAHGISEASRATMADGSILDYIWLGAEHMLTGYDHLLFLFGVLFFLTGFRDVLRFITAFTVGHCITLLGATLAGVSANAYLIDAVIALSVIYKGFENLDGFNKWFGKAAPNLLAMVFVFGLIHGFGLSTRLQELTLGESGMVGRILAFNLGVELGQVAALTVILIFFTRWRRHRSFNRFGTVANGGLVLAGVALFAFQIVGYVSDIDHHESHATTQAEHDSEHGGEHGHQDDDPSVIRCDWQGAMFLWDKKPAIDASQPGSVVRLNDPLPMPEGDAGGLIAELIIKQVGVRNEWVLFDSVDLLAPETVLAGTMNLVQSTAHKQLDFITDALRARGLTGELWLGVGDNLETEPTNAIQSWCKIRL